MSLLELLPAQKCGNIQVALRLLSRTCKDRRGSLSTGLRRTARGSSEVRGIITALKLGF